MSTLTEDLQDSKEDVESGIGIIDNIRIIDEEHEDFNDSHSGPYAELIIRRTSGNTMRSELPWPDHWDDKVFLVTLLKYYGVEPSNISDIEERFVPVHLGTDHDIYQLTGYAVGNEWHIDYGKIRTAVEEQESENEDE